MKLTWLSLGLLSTIATAEEWSSFDDSFPSIVCSDGFTGCMVDGERVNIDNVTDKNGRFHPADMRVDFFNFEPLPSMSPFVALSQYETKKEEPAAVEVEPPEPEPEAAPVAAVPIPPTPSPSYEPPSPSYEPSSPPPPVPVVISQPEPVPEPEPAAPVVQPPPQNTSPNGMRPPIPGERRPPKVPIPPSIPDPVPEPEPEPELEPVVEAPPPIPPPPPVTVNAVEQQEGCDNLTLFEANAMMGTLPLSGRQCLDGRAGSSSEPVTIRARASILLITDAQTRGDTKDWERLVKRHLKSIEKSQPDLCLSYALYLSQKGTSRAKQVIKWSEVGLTNKHVWSGEARIQKVNALYQVRAFASNSLWQLSEQKLVSERSSENQAAADDWRGKTKNFSREWLDFARAAGADTSAARQLCVSAAGDINFCQD